MPLTDNTALAVDIGGYAAAGQEVEPRRPANGLEGQTIEGAPVIAQRRNLNNEGLGFTSERESISVDSTTAKLISRSIAELTPDTEYKRFLDDKRTLLQKKYSEGLSKKEDLALQLTIWNIDRIEDAKYGRQLDALEAIVKTHEAVASKISQTADRFEELILRSMENRRSRQNR